MPDAIKVIVCGALGRTGNAVLNGLVDVPELDLVGGVAPHASVQYLDLPKGGGLIPVARDTESLLKRARPRVVVDFTRADAAMENATLAFKYGASPVIGTSGLSVRDREELARLAESSGLGVVLVPNFAIGAVLSAYFARIAARFFAASEIVELHHEHKIDAPSGSALAVAQGMREARGRDFDDVSTERYNLPGVRGGELGGVRLHSIRLPGLVAHQEIMFGGSGEVLTIRHDSITRDSFVSGVVLACRAVVGRTGLTFGLEELMGLA